MKVLVIGGGIAGLKASLDLAKKGFAVMLLEATHRLGGRIHTIYTADGTPIELGASYWEGYNNNPFYFTFFRAESIAQTRRLDEHQSVLISLDSGKVNPQLLEYYQIAKTLLHDAEKKGAGVTFLDYIKLLDFSAYSEQAIYWIKRFLENALQHHCTPLASGGFPTFKRDNPGDEAWNDEDADFCFVQNGYQHVIKQLAAECAQAGVQIILNTPVIKVIDLGNAVQVLTERETFTTDRVVCTLPIGVLKKQLDTLFEPPLAADKKQALNMLGVHDATRVVLEFPDVFWDNRDGPYIYLDDPALPCLLEFRNAYPLCGKPILLTGKYSDYARKVDEDKLIQKILMDLQKAYPNKAIPHPIQTWVYSWTNNPYACGAYPYRKATMDEALQCALERPHGNIYFAGADFSRFGFSVHNAYFNAQKIAQKLK